MLHDFLSAHREDLIERCKLKVLQRDRRSATGDQLRYGIPLFLDQLVRTLRIEQTSAPMDSRVISGSAGGDQALSEIGVSAAQHGGELLRLGFTVDQVVHDYGDLCQAITDLAYERDAPFKVDEFRTLNRCLDNAIADAVTEFSRQRDSVAAELSAAELNERLGFLAHELRNLLGSAMLAFTAARTGGLPLSGATGTVIERSLVGLTNLINRSLAEVRMRTKEPLRTSVFSLADFISEVKTSAELDADVRGCRLVVSPVDVKIALVGSRDLMLSAVGNLLQNAFKFTYPGTEVHLVARSLDDRTLIEVADHCGGLPFNIEQAMFAPFSQHSKNRSGLGLGLSIARKSVELNEGVLRVKNVPGVGCVFTVELPRYTLT